MTIIGLLSGRLELGTSFGSMSPEMLHDINRLYPMMSDPKSPRPVDMLLGKQHPEVYVYDVTPQWAQVILFNSHEEDRTIEAPFSGDQSETGSLGLKADVIGGETMDIVFAANGYGKASVTVDHGKAEIAVLDDDLWVLKLDCKDNQKVQWQLQF